MGQGLLCSNCIVWLGSYNDVLNEFINMLSFQASTRFICSLLSLPIPGANPLAGMEGPTNSSGRSGMFSEKGRVQKLLLFGFKGSGTSTIFKQVFYLSFIDLKFTFTY